jgi:hypothetical protein
MLKETMNTMVTMVLIVAVVLSGIWMFTHTGIINGIPFLICVLALVWNEIKDLAEKETEDNDKEQA